MLAYPVSGSEIVGPRGLRESEHDNKTRGNVYPTLRHPPFRVSFTFASSPLSESLKQAYVVCERERLEGVKYNIYFVGGGGGGYTGGCNRYVYY